MDGIELDIPELPAKAPEAYTPVIPSREFLQTAEQGNTDGEQTDL